MHLDALFSPKTVAVIGASRTSGKIGHTILQNMIEAGFKGELYPVNPHADSILGLKAMHSIAELPSPLDLAVLAVPRDAVVPSLKALLPHRLRAAVVVSAGYRESGKEGWKIEGEVARICRDNDIALIGPNCLGVLSTADGVNASFAPGFPRKGNIAFFSQSGALCSAILDWAIGESIGFSKFVSLGNKAVVDETHMLYALAQDPDTKVVLGYVENVEHGEAFLRMARKITREKPVIMLKGGTTAAGAKAASSHTGAMVGSENAYEAAFRQTGILRAHTVSEMFDLAQAFSTQPLPLGPRLAIVTNAGGPAVLAADAAEKSLLSMTPLSAQTVEDLKASLPTTAGIYNPVDILADADQERLERVASVVLNDPLVDSMLVLIAPTAFTDPEKLARAVVAVTAQTHKPVLCCFMGKARMEPGIEILREASIPCYLFPEQAVRSLEAMYRFGVRKSRPSPVMASVEGRKDVVRRVIKDVRAQGMTDIPEDLAHEILKAYDLPAARAALARTSDEAVAAAAKIGYPVVCKVASPQISHKADAGAVVVGVDTPEALRQAFLEITGHVKITRPDAHVTGCMIQEQAPQNMMEVVIGFRRDDHFGPLLRFSLGGIYMDVLGDISYRLAPVSMHDARQLIRGIDSYMLLKGVRGEPAANIETLEDIVIRLSQLAMDFPEIYEAELGPVLVNNERAVVADARLMLLPR
ncbi:MAG: acetate--CoA ligase family protein [Acidobacteriota bacterium]